MDGELSDSENLELDAHLAQCVSCKREYQLLTFPNRIAQANPPPVLSPFFYSKLKAHIDGEIPQNAAWQTLLGMARLMVPALASITLALLLVFSYQQMRNSEVDLDRTYDRAFLSEDQLGQMPVVDQGDTAYENILNAITEPVSNYHRNQSLK